MKIRMQLLTLAMAGMCLSGCTSQGVFSNVNGSRIAAPATGKVQYPTQIANLPDPYYGQPPASQASPTLGNTPVQGPIASNPAILNQPTGPVTIPSNNLTVATSTTLLQPTRTAANPNTGASASPNPAATETTITGGMPLNDATRVATSRTQPPNTGIFNRTWEYVAQPNLPQPMQRQYQFTTQPTYATGPTMIPGYAVPRSSTYTYPNGYPGTPPAANIAEGWRQRDSRDIPSNTR